MIENPTNRETQQKTIRLWWIAIVIISIVWYGPFVAMIVSAFHAYSLLIVLPLVLVLVAWAWGWHLVAGTSMLMASLGAVWAARAVDDLDWFLLCMPLVVIPCSVGGILHILAWWRERSRVSSRGWS